MFTYLGVSSLLFKNPLKTKKKEKLLTRGTPTRPLNKTCYLVISLSGEFVYRFVQHVSVV